MARKQSRNNNVKKSDYSKFWVSFIILANVIFTSLILFTFYITGTEPQALIGAWFSFTTVELWQLARIKNKKIEKEIKFNKNNNCDSTNNQEWG